MVRGARTRLGSRWRYSPDRAKPAGEHGEIEELFLEVQRMEPMPEIVIEVGVVVERVCCVDQQAIALVRPAWVRCVAVGYQGDLLAGGPDSVGE